MRSAEGNAHGMACLVQRLLSADVSRGVGALAALREHCGVDVRYHHGAGSAGRVGAARKASEALLSPQRRQHAERHVTGAARHVQVHLPWEGPQRGHLRGARARSGRRRRERPSAAAAHQLVLPQPVQAGGHQVVHHVILGRHGGKHLGHQALLFLHGNLLEA